ncbi:MAG: glycosyltransferase, partial [Acidobacteriaceae bacterium]|nr:glycosyltransferase [Acidobacteriaceae bacterium]
YRPVAPVAQYLCDLSYLGTYAADRQPKLRQLLNGAAALQPSHRFIVAGAQYPKGIEWRSNVQRMIHVYPREHPAFYSSSRFTLNLTRDAMVEAGYSPSVRLFEAAACGATIVSDVWAGLEEFLTPGREILLPQDVYELVEMLRNMPEQERQQIGSRARERIIAHHSSAKRASQFETIVAGCYARRA